MPKRWSLLAGILILSLIALDFLGFCQRAARANAPDNPKADGIIVFTGGSGLRIEAGVRLIEAGSAPKALISGVHPDVTLDELARRAGGEPETYQCCVEFDYAAESTAGNAEESAEWVVRNEYESVILVTSDYHVPRSLLLVGKKIPNVELVPYPVRTRINPETPFSDAKTFRGLLWEWLKWRVTNLRSGGSG
ncbi:MAG: YdcF family protein [Pseudomonadota bacterium]